MHSSMYAINYNNTINYNDIFYRIDIKLKNSKNIILLQLQNIVQEDQYYRT